MTYLSTYLLDLNILSLSSVSIYYMESVTTILRVYSHNTQISNNGDFFSLQSFS